MRILYLNNGLSYGGAEKLLNDLLPLISKDNYCELLILSDKDEKYLQAIENNGIKVDIMPSSLRNPIRKVSYIRKYAINGKFDIVHANEFPTIYYASVAKKLAGKEFPKLIMTEHSTDNKRRHKSYLRPIEQWIYRSYDFVISISKATQQALLKWIRAKELQKFYVVNNGVPLNNFINAKPYEKNDVFAGIKSDDRLLCMVGSFKEQKNHKLMIEIMEKLPSRYKLILLGEGPLKIEIEELIREKQLQDRVHCLGFRKDVAQVMKTSDIVVIPSKWEGFGLIAVEAMACGKPVVASNVPGLAEVIGNAGIKCSTCQEFVDAIRRLEDLDAIRNIVKTQFTQAEKFNIETMKENYVKLYRSLL